MRKDIVNGQIQVVIRDVSNCRSCIQKFDIWEGKASFVLLWTLEEIMKSGRLTRVPKNPETYYFSTTLKLIESGGGRIQFDFPGTDKAPGGWAIIYPANDHALVSLPQAPQLRGQK